MSKKKKHSSFKSVLKNALFKYSPLILFLPAWLITPPKYIASVTAFLIFLCYIHFESFNWIHNPKEDIRVKYILLWARFWRYGYFAILLALMLLSTSMQFHKSVLFYGCLVYGAYTIIIALSRCRHFICGMQDASHQPMKPYARKIPYSSYQRDGLLIGLFFLAMGFWGIAVS